MSMRSNRTGRLMCTYTILYLSSTSIYIISISYIYAWTFVPVESHFPLSEIRLDTHLISTPPLGGPLKICLLLLQSNEMPMEDSMYSSPTGKSFSPLVERIESGMLISQFSSFPYWQKKRLSLLVYTLYTSNWLCVFGKSLIANLGITSIIRLQNSKIIGSSQVRFVSSLIRHEPILSRKLPSKSTT